MSALVWDKTSEHLYETGNDHAVVYPYNSTSKAYDSGVAWNGITGITESPSGADETALYADNIKYLSLRSAEEYGMTVTAYTYPDEFAELDGSAFAEDLPGVRIYQQARKTFGMSYRTIIGNDTESNDHGYKLHLVYGLTASPSERGYSTVNDSPEAIEFSWEMTGVPVAITGYKNSCLITIDSTAFSTTEKAAKLKALEDVLYGTDGEVTYPEKTGLTADSYNEADPQGSENPHDLGWFERTGTGTEMDPYVYSVSADTSVNNEKTYWIFTAGDNPKTMGLYEKNVSDQYVLTNDTSVQDGKKYYEKVTSEGTVARLPLPDEVFSILKGIGG